MTTLPAGVTVSSNPALGVTNVTPGPVAVGSGPIGPVGPAGPSGILATLRGAYNPITTYTAGPPPDAVIGSNGHWYVSLANGNVGHDPTTDGGVHWADQLPVTVVSGSSAGGVPAWAPTTFYAVNTLVTNSGTTYICLVAHTSGGSFTGAGTNWEVLAGGATVVTAPLVGGGTNQGGHYDLDSNDNLGIGTTLAALQRPAAHANVALGSGPPTGGTELPSSSGGPLNAITTGFDNTALGAGVMPVATTSHSTVGIGADTLLNLTTGNGNTAVGAQSSQQMTTASNNSAFGASSLQNNVTGIQNTAIGFGALAATTASGNTALGYAAGNALTSGGSNTAVGTSALAVATTATGEVAVGQGALIADVSGVSNTAVGQVALTALTNGANNTAIGNGALVAVTGGSSNSAIGWQSGQSLVAQSGSTCLGFKAGTNDGTNTTTDNASMTLVGEKAQSALPNVIVLGKAVATRPNLCFGGFPTGAGFFGNGVGVAFLANAVTNPNANPTGGGLLYVSAGALVWRGSSGTVTTIAVA